MAAASFISAAQWAGTLVSGAASIFAAHHVHVQDTVHGEMLNATRQLNAAVTEFGDKISLLWATLAALDFSIQWRGYCILLLFLVLAFLCPLGYHKFSEVRAMITSLVAIQGQITADLKAELDARAAAILGTLEQRYQDKLDAMQRDMTAALAAKASQSELDKCAQDMRTATLQQSKRAADTLIVDVEARLDRKADLHELDELDDKIIDLKRQWKAVQKGTALPPAPPSSASAPSPARTETRALMRPKSPPASAAPPPSLGQSKWADSAPRAQASPAAKPSALASKWAS